MLKDTSPVGPDENRVKSMPHLSGDLGEHYSGYIQLPGTTKRLLLLAGSIPIGPP